MDVLRHARVPGAGHKDMIETLRETRNHVNAVSVCMCV
jgi:hypothetical protein